jgi:cytochrome c biogenesis protein CcmG, thiol:disulfide interchange protein DsbE
MSKQWIIVGIVVLGLAAGATGLALIAPRAGVEINQPAPDFRVLNLRTGDSVSLKDDYRGSVTLVNIWATWCVPCRAEMPAMQELYDSLAPRGFKIAAISIDEGNPQDVIAFAQELGLTFDILHDRDGLVQQHYQTTGVPESFLLDRWGVLVKRVIGAHDWGSPVNRSTVARLLEQPGS